MSDKNDVKNDVQDDFKYKLKIRNKEFGNERFSAMVESWSNSFA